jgi:hypothetical protein
MMGSFGKNLGMFGGRKGASAGPGLPQMSPSSMMNPLLGDMGGAEAGVKKKIDRDKLRKTRKAAKTARKKNRKK